MSSDKPQTSFARAALLALGAAAASALLVGVVAPHAKATATTPAAKARGAKAAAKPAATKPAATKPASTTPSKAQAAATASGSLTVNGKVTPVHYGYARQVRGFFDPTKNDVEVLLSDVPLTGKALTDGFAREDLAKSGSAHIFEITIDASGKPVSTMFRHNGFSGPEPSGVDTSDAFAKKSFTATSIDASYRAIEPKEFFGDSFSFDVSFHLPIAPKAS